MNYYEHYILTLTVVHVVLDFWCWTTNKYVEQIHVW